MAWSGGDLASSAAAGTTSSTDASTTSSVGTAVFNEPSAAEKGLTGTGRLPVVIRQVTRRCRRRAGLGFLASHLGAMSSAGCFGSGVTSFNQRTTES